MKVKIGKYKNWIGPYQVASALCFWANEVEDEFGIKRKPEWVHNFGEFLATGKWGKPEKADNLPLFEKLAFEDESKTWFYRLLLWIDSKRKQKIKVRIDPWDTWNTDYTLALIVTPLLKQLQKKKHGAPMVDDEDVPPRLRSTSASPVAEGELDELFFARWDWCLNEMIVAFENIVNGDASSGCDHYSVMKGEEIKEPASFDEEGNPTSWKGTGKKAEKFFTHEELYKKQQERQRHALMLFGKYYRSLWD